MRALLATAALVGSMLVGLGVAAPVPAQARTCASPDVAAYGYVVTSFTHAGVSCSHAQHFARHVVIFGSVTGWGCVHTRHDHQFTVACKIRDWITHGHQTFDVTYHRA